jgi:competence protein ComEC
LPLLVVAGIVFGVVASPDLAGALGSATLSLAIASAAVAVGAAVRRVLLVAALLLIAVAAGARARDAVLTPPLTTALDSVLDDRAAPPVWLEGRIADDAAVSRPRFDGETGDTALVPVNVTRVRIDGAWRAASGRAMLAIGGQAAAGSIDEWTRGRTIAAPVLVHRPQTWRNFGMPGERWQTLRRSSDITGSVKSAALVEVTRGDGWSESGAAIRRWVRRDLTRVVAPISTESAAVMIAVLIGDRSRLDDTTTVSLQRAGTYHVIAISGGNIAIAVIACVWVLRLVLRSRRVIAVITMAVVVMYGAVVGDQASVERAVAAAMVVLGVQAAGWCVSTRRVLLLAAMIVLLIDPLTAVDAGAWLSFGATLGIVLFATPIATAIRPALERVRGRPVADRGVATVAIPLFAATIAAEMALAPISAAVFSQVSVAGLGLNFIAIPAMAVVQFAGIAILASAHVVPPLAALAAYVGHWGVLAILRSAALLQWAPWLAWQTPPVWLGWMLIYYAALATAVWSTGRRSPRSVTLRRLALVTFGLSLLVIAGSPLWPRSGGPPAGWLRVTFLDVGQGDSILTQFPTGQSLLVDAGGSATGFDIGSRVVRPALWALGVQHLDWLAVTHGDIDHAGGTLSVLQTMRPREIWEGVPVPTTATMLRLRAAAQTQHAAWERLTVGPSFEVGSVAIDVFNPPVPDWERRATRNDDSLVLRLSFGDVSVLLTGDISAAVEQGLPFDAMAASGQPRLRLLKAPHHGSRTSSSDAMVGGWLPQAVFISVGRGNTFGHPSPDVLARYDRDAVDVFRTDRDGAIAVETDGRVVRVRTATGRTWRLAAVGPHP